MMMQNKQLSLHDWQRTHPIAIVHFGVHFLRGLASQFIYLIPAFVGLRSTFESNKTAVIMIAIGILCLLVIYAIAAYWKFVFRIHEGTVEIHKGILKQVKLNLPFEKIQDVKLNQPFYYRWSDAREVVLDTAGSASEEAKIVALPLAIANQITHLIHQQTDVAAHSDATDPDNPSSSEEVLDQRSVADLVIHGITSNRVWIILGAFAPFFDDVIRYFEAHMTDFELIERYSTEHHSLASVIMMMIATALLAYLVITLVSIAGSIVAFYGFSLSKDDTRLKKKAGLINRYQTSVQMTKVQHLEYQQNALDTLFRRFNLSFKQLRHVYSQQAKTSQSIMVPAVDSSEVAQLAQCVLRHDNPLTREYQRISRRFIIQKSLFLTCPLLAAAIVAYTLTDQAFNIMWLAAAVAVLELLIVARWWRWGYAQCDNILYNSQWLYWR